MSMRSDLWWRNLWPQVLGLLVLVVVVLPGLWACGLLPGSTGMAIFVGGILTATFAAVWFVVYVVK